MSIPLNKSFKILKSAIDDIGEDNITEHDLNSAVYSYTQTGPDIAVKYLLELSNKKNFKLSLNNTLDYAILTNKYKIVKYLVNIGGAEVIPNHYETALYVEKKNKSKDDKLSKFLQENVTVTVDEDTYSEKGEEMYVSEEYEDLIEANRQMIKQEKSIKENERVLDSSLMGFIESLKDVYTLNFEKYFGFKPKSEEEMLKILSSDKEEYISTTSLLIGNEIGIYAWDWAIFQTLIRNQSENFTLSVENYKWLYLPLLPLLKKMTDSEQNTILEIVEFLNDNDLYDYLISIGYEKSFKPISIRLAAELKEYKDWDYYVIIKMIMMLKRKDPIKFNNILQFSIIYSNFTIVATYIRSYLSEVKRFEIDNSRFWSDVIFARDDTRFKASENSLIYNECTEILNNLTLRDEIKVVYSELKSNNLLNTDVERMVIHHYFNKLYKIAISNTFETYDNLILWRGFNIPKHKVNLNIDSIFSFSYNSEIAKSFEETGKVVKDEPGYTIGVSIPTGVKIIPILMCSLHDENEIVLMERGKLKFNYKLTTEYNMDVYDFIPSGKPFPKELPPFDFIKSTSKISRSSRARQKTKIDITNKIINDYLNT